MYNYDRHTIKTKKSNMLSHQHKLNSINASGKINN
jgi:hypothetical protein